MAKRMISVRVDEDILRDFDAVAWERKLSRTALLEQLMSGEVGSGLVLVDQETHDNVRRTVNAAVADGLDEVAAQASCEHPKDKRVKFAWGSKCGVCNSIVR